MVELVDPTPTATFHEAFMSVKPPNFRGTERPNKAEEWLWEIEKSFSIIEIPEKLKVSFMTYILIEDVEAYGALYWSLNIME